MFGRADFERFFSVGRAVFIALLSIVVLVAVISIAKSDEQLDPVMPKGPFGLNIPVVCMMDEDFEKLEGGMILQWQGITEKVFRTRLWHTLEGEAWMITREKAGNHLICIIGAGTEMSFIGEEARL